MTGLLLVNLGSPDEPTTRAVRRYLKQFLSDPRVVDVGALGRALLLNFVILPFRPAKSAAAYRKIWTEAGSPLVVHSRALARAVGERLGERWKVILAMRYGSPSIASAIDELAQAAVDRIVVLPLYPQQAASSTGSSIEEVFRVAARRWIIPNLTIAPPFYDEPGYLDAFAAAGAPVIEAERPDHVLFSFHGIPERHVRKVQPGCLASADCCDTIQRSNRDCYRAQCFATARAIAARLGLEGRAASETDAGLVAGLGPPKPGVDWSVSFQSRLGRTPWIRPFTDLVIRELAAAGKKRVVVFSPSFVADCLETLEEIGIRGAEDFRAHGGERLALVPSLNAADAWVSAVAALARRYSVASGPS